MKRLLVLSGFLSLRLFLPSAYAGTAALDTVEVNSITGPAQMWQAGGWIGADTMIAVTGQQQKSGTDHGLTTDWFDQIDYPAAPLPAMLIPQHTNYFVTVLPDGIVTFSVLYYDAFGNAPKAGYPRAVYWKAGTSDCTTVVLDYQSTEGLQSFYRKEISLTVPGVYHYCYSVHNDQLSDAYVLQTASFVVTSCPGTINNTGYANESAVANAGVLLRWGTNDDPSASVTYRLYAGTDPSGLSLAYEGTASSYQLTELAYNMRYYWMVEAVNQYGVSTKSSLFNFTTIAAPQKAFNYPNPFNPAASQRTNVVFNMPERGSAELSVFTEMGDLCWSRFFDNLGRGANEIQYDGRDDRGRLLYNGTYLCVINKKYAGISVTDRCRLLIVK